MHWCGQGRFEQSREILSDSLWKVNERIEELYSSGNTGESFFSSFQPPDDSVITGYKAINLKHRIEKLSILISDENLSGDVESALRLSKFVMLNRHEEFYELDLNSMLDSMNKSDPLYDNVLLERSKLIDDAKMRAIELERIHSSYPKRDGGIEAYYELGMTRIEIWRDFDGSGGGDKKPLLIEARGTLTDFIARYADSIFTMQARESLSTLPRVE